MSLLFGGIEAGGTKFICAVGTCDGVIKKSIRITTKTPHETMPRVIDFFKKIHKKTQISAIGVGSFGMIDLHENSKNYGYISTSAKASWENFNFLKELQKNFDIPLSFDLDVNAAALGEKKWGAAKKCNTFLYITIGTGIGVGGMVRGELIHGLIHPEMGHMFIPHDKSDQFSGTCKYHRTCLEGIACGPAFNNRWNINKSSELPRKHPGWQLEAKYLAYGLVNLIFTFSPEKIICGGGIMKNSHLFPLIRNNIKIILNNYIQHDTILKNINKYIVPPGLGDNSGILGALALAAQKFKNIVGKVYQRPWGNYKTLVFEPKYQVKKITVEPGGCLSLQKHYKRHEHWTIVQGEPIVTIENKEQKFKPNSTIYIPANTLHQIKNDTSKPVIFIEVQYGSYLGEDDIVRVKDIYNRQ